VCICDTAGRLQAKKELMDELGKVHRVIGKAIPGAPHEVWLVLDATNGQNAISQAKEFAQVVQVTGIVLTKLDGTAKGGVVIGICDEMKLPVRYIGIGEKVADLRPSIRRALQRRCSPTREPSREPRFCLFDPRARAKRAGTRRPENHWGP
jgi:fused signal recognition particle receptor